MKKIYIILPIVLIFLIALYFSVNIDKKTEQDLTTFSSRELGLEFSYPIGDNGYVLTELSQNQDKNLLKTIVLERNEDVLKRNEGPVPSEGMPTITMHILKNPKKQWSENWAVENEIYSNLNLKIGDVSQYVLSGANAIRYMADGLYQSDNIVVAHGGYVYVFSGMFMDKESKIYFDFDKLIKTVKFIEQ